MATNQTGIAIVIKAFLPTGKTLDETYAALTVVKTAHETGDYAPLLSAAKIDEVKTEQKTRRVEEQPQEPPPADNAHVAEGDTPFPEPTADAGTEPGLKLDTDPDVPDFLKSKKKKAA